MGVGAFSSNGIPIHSQDNAVLALVGLERVPLSIAESSGSSGLVGGCYPPGTVVDVKQDLDNVHDWGSCLHLGPLDLSQKAEKATEHSAFMNCSQSRGLHRILETRSNGHDKQRRWRITSKNTGTSSSPRQFRNQCSILRALRDIFRSLQFPQTLSVDCLLANFPDQAQMLCKSER